MRRTLTADHHHCNNLDDCQALIRRLGYRNSAADWEDERHANAFSVETHGPATYNHPRAAIQLDKHTATLDIISPCGTA